MKPMAEIELDNLEELQAASLEQEEPQENPEFQGPQEAESSHVSVAPQASQEPVSHTQKLVRSLVSGDDEVDEMTIDGFRQMLETAPRWLLSQWKMMLICLFGTFLYITNGYQAQAEMKEETNLEAELKHWRYLSILRVSELTLFSRQSLLEEKLHEQGDTTLMMSKVPPFTIKVKE